MPPKRFCDLTSNYRNRVFLNSNSLSARQSREVVTVENEIEVAQAVADETLEPTIFQNVNDTSLESSNSLQATSSSQSSASSNPNDEVLKLPLNLFLTRWVTYWKIPRTASEDLLKYMKNNYDNELPSSYKTLLKTPTSTNLIDVAPGKYLHLGLVDSLRMATFNFASFNTGHHFILDFNIDGARVKFY